MYRNKENQIKALQEARDSRIKILAQLETSDNWTVKEIWNSKAYTSNWHNADGLNLALWIVSNGRINDNVTHLIEQEKKSSKTTRRP